MHDFLNSLKSSGFDPKTTIDAGVAHGTKELYQTFPNSYYYLFEPVEEFSFHILKHLGDGHRGMKTKINGEYHQIALSDNDGEGVIRTPKEWIKGEYNGSFGGSSLSWDNQEDAKEQIFENINKRTRIIKRTRLDSFFENLTPKEPILLKTDLQGHDLNALYGAENFLKKCEVVITEIGGIGNMAIKQKTNPEDFIVFMNDQNFSLADFLGPIRHQNKRLRQIDACFIKKNSLHLKANNT